MKLGQLPFYRLGAPLAACESSSDHQSRKHANPRLLVVYHQSRIPEEIEMDILALHEFLFHNDPVIPGSYQLIRAYRQQCFYRPCMFCRG